MSNLLEGVRVIESATLFNGDHLGMLLGDLGADVIKVESPFQGDYLRDFLGQITPHNSPAHIQVNKNKRSVTLDLRKDAGREIFWRLLDTADVFVDGNVAGACEKLGVGYADQRAHKADIVYCRYTGYGEGPYATIPTHGQMMDALAAATPMEMGDDGFMHRRPHPGGFGGTESGGEGTAAGGIYAAFHVAAALVHRARTGVGSFIDVAGADAVIAHAWIAATYALNEHRVTDRIGMPQRAGQDMESAKYQHYRTKDGKVVLFCAIEHKFWDNFCRAVGKDEWSERKDMRKPVDFAGGDEELRRQLQEVFASRTQHEWVQVALEHDIPIGPAPTEVGQLPDDPHLRTREIFLEGEHPHAGPFTYVGQPAMVAGDPYRVRRPAPLLGEHTGEVLTGLGYGEDDVARLREAKVI